MKYKIELKDGSFKEFSHPPTALELAQSIGPGLTKEAVGVLINDDPEIQDLRLTLRDGDKVDIVTLPSEKALEVIRHSAAHVMAQAVQNLWPEVKVTIGPVIESAFYYDFDTDKKFTEEDLQKIEKEMKTLLSRKYELSRELWSKSKAIDYFEKKGELLKKEIIEDLGEKKVSIYKQGPWLDLCRGPHVQHLGQIGAVKVLSQSGSYWRGDVLGKKLQRIYGTAFHSQKQLKAFLKKREEAKQNDHRQIGKRLQLFWFSDLSPGSPFFTPRGTALYQNLQKFLREKYQEYGYQEVISPQIYHSDLFERSGHLKHFKDNMYSLLEKLPNDSDQNKTKTFLKPMNCPGHCLLYKKDRKSYRDLPWRVADFGRLHRREPAGALHGLTRVKSFCQDDAHIFCSLKDLSKEIQNGIKMLQEFYKTLGLENYNIELSTRPEKRMGEEKLWDKAEKALADSLEVLKIPYSVNPGEGAFYGPKLDICIRDVFDRFWQLGTFQCDFNLPQAFDLSYINEKDQAERPVMIHRAVLGSLERFIGLYLEHSKGRLPLWLSPLQVLILPLTIKEQEFSLQIQKTLEKKEIVCKIDRRNEKLSYKVRHAQNQQIPYMIIVGQKEVQSKLISVRLRTGELFSDLDLHNFSDKLFEEIQNRHLRSVLLSYSFKGGSH